MLNSGRRGRRAPDGYGILSVNEKFNQTNYPIPIVDSYAITDGSYNPIDDLALDTAGGQTVVIYGSGFTAGVTVNINGSNVSPVTLLDSGRLSFTSPALASASYTIYVSNTDGATAIYVPGLVYSGLPTWSSPAAGSIGTSYETKSVSTLSSNTFIATGDAPITYSISSGNLPSGVTLNSNGTLSGTLPVTASATTYSFTIKASDAQLQDSSRSFSLTINPDAVTWVAPTQNGSLTVYETQAFSTPLSATSAAGYGVMYSANTLPTGITLSNNTGTLNGYANTVGNTFAQLTATANTSGRYATSNVRFTVNQDAVTWSSPANNASYSLNQDAVMSSVPLSATSAAGYGIQYTASSLPTGVTLSGNTISGTPTSSGTTSTTLTATANTTNRVSYLYINWTVSVAADTYFANTVLLLSADSSSQTNSFISDNSNNNIQLTIVGDVKPNNFSPYTIGYYSNYFNGTNGYLANTSSSSATAMGTGDFTIECWALSNQIYDAGAIFATYVSGSYSYILRYNGTAQWQLYYGQTNATNYTFKSTESAYGQWVHHALVRSSGTLNWYINGNLVYSVADSYNMTDNQIHIGTYGGSYWKGYISNFRIVKGTAVYTGPFTPPTSPLTAISGTTLLTCQSNKIKDESNTNLTLTNYNVKVAESIPFAKTNPYNTYGSSYFSGSYGVARVSHLQTGPKQFKPFGTGDFTIELWCYLPSSGFLNGGALLNLSTSSNNTGSGYELYLRAENNVYWRAVIGAATSYLNYDTPTPIVCDQWSHHAIVRVSGVTKYYVNGVERGSATDTFNYTSSYCYIANFGDYCAKGHISDVRIVSGTGIYTTAFTPPTAPLTAVANTQLLTLQTNGGANNKTFVDQSTANNIITRTGNPTQGTFSPYGSNWSNYFDGSSTYLSTPSANTSTGFTFGTGDFTVELWVNFTSYTSSGAIFNIPYSSAGAPYGMILRQAGTRYDFYMGDGSASWVILSANIGTLPSLGTWQHIAIVRTNGYLKVYLDGTQTYSIADTTSLPYQYLTLGQYAGYYFNGYVSNFRVLKGTALYTTSFTPPTAPLTAIANTSVLTCQTNRFEDSSPNKVFLNAPNVSPVVTSHTPFARLTSVPTSYSTFFTRANNNYLSVPASSAYAFGTGAYTIEAWVYFNSTDTYRTVFQFVSAGNGPVLTTLTGGALRMWNGSNDYVDTSTGIITTNTWYHIAWVRESTSLLKLYLNGTLVNTITSGVVVSTDLTGTPTLNIGYFSSFGHYMDGYISNFRVTKGQALYTTTFTPSTTPLTTTSQGATAANVSLLTCQNNTFFDNSNNHFNITAVGDTKPSTFNPFGVTNTTGTSYSPTVNGGSIYFDGTGDYLQTTNLDSLRFRTYDFTIEFWLYPTKISAAMHIISTRSNGTQGGDIDIRTDYIGTTSTTLYVVCGGADFSVIYTGSLINTWTHFAAVRRGSTVYFYANGVLLGSGAASSPPGTYFSVLNIGGSSGMPAAGYEEMTGYLSDLRIIPGKALYTSNFYPSLTPATPIQTIGANTYTSSLCFTGNYGGIIDQTSKNDIETLGDVIVAPETPYAGSYYSNYFDNSVTENSLVTSGSNVSLGSGNFTIECWLNPTTMGDGRAALKIGDSVAAITLYGWSTSNISIAGYNSSGTNVFSASGPVTLTTGTWTHHAIVRNSGVITWYVNGTSVYTVSNSTNYTQTGASIGYWSATGGWIGYISNVRVVVGTAVYTTSFTPPTSPLTAISGTQLLTCQNNKFIDNSTNAYTFTKTGPVGIKTINPFKRNTGQSYYFDGTGDYLYSIDKPSTQLYSDYTIEYWVNQLNFSVQRTHITLGDLQIYTTTSGVITVTGGSGGGTTYVTGAAIKAGEWTHISLTRKSGVGTTLYINGTRSGDVAVDSTAYSNSTMFIGSTSSASSLFSGYMSDVRITKLCRYTANNTAYLNSGSPYLTK